MRPIAALESAIGIAMFLDHNGKRYPKPGAIIEKLSSEHRDALKKLTSDEAQHGSRGPNYYKETK